MSTLVQVLPAVRGVMRPRAKLVVLIKPQFEALRGEVRRVHASAPSSAELSSTQVGSGGVVRDPAVHASVLKRVVSGIEAMGFACQGTTPSPLRGAKEGNIEFLAAFGASLVMDISPLLITSVPSYGYLAVAHRFLRTRYPFRFPQTL